MQALDSPLVARMKDKVSALAHVASFARKAKGVRIVQTEGASNMFFILHADVFLIF
jgi:hypothetical protein